METTESKRSLYIYLLVGLGALLLLAGIISTCHLFLPHSPADRGVAETRFYSLFLEGATITYYSVFLVLFLRLDRRRAAAEKAVQNSERKYRHILEQSPLSIVVVDRNGTIRDWNTAAEELTGLPRGEVLGKLYWDVQLRVTTVRERTEETRSRIRARVEQVMREKQVKKDAVPLEYRLQSIGGAIRIVQTTVFPITDTSEFMMVGISRDVTEQHQTEMKMKVYHEKLRSLSSELLLIEERERCRIAGHLHDNLGQELAAAKIQLGRLLAFLPEREKAVGATLRDHIDRSIRYTRSLTAELSPPLLHQLGLIPAIEWLAEEMGKRYQLKCTVVKEGAISLKDREECIILFRAVRELLMNIVKHASARRVTLSVEHREERVVIEIEDDGIGFDPAAMRATGSFGLFSIHEQLASLQGELNIISAPGEGARVRITLPLRQKQPSMERNAI